MRTTIRLDDRLLVEAKQLAAQTGRTLTAVIEDALREALARHRPSPKKKRIVLPAHGSGGLQPGVDLDASASLWEMMDSEHAPR
jgi:hypothetical protein